MTKKMGFLFLILLIAGLFCFSESAEAASTLRYGSTGAQVKELQTNLNSLGYRCGSADGIFGKTTKNAVISFQRAQGLAADGIVGVRTWEKLNGTSTAKTADSQSNSTNLSASRVLKMGMSGSDVKALQNVLTRSGYSCGSVDGVYGQATKNAVMSFQRSNGLTADGIAGSKTMSKLNGAQSQTTQSGNQEEQGSTNSYRLGDKGTAVADLQKKLNGLGYACGSADGIFGRATEAAIRSFQSAQGLSADGVAGAQTLKRLEEATPQSTVQQTVTSPSSATLKLGSTGADVQKLQQRLNELGYDCGSADGIYGSGTKAMVLRFQQQNSLTADGIAGSATQAKLYSDSACAIKSEVSTVSSDAGSTSLGQQTLQQGMSGSAVRLLQQRLNELGFSNGIDGIFGSGTRRTLISYQLTRGLEADGVAGPTTLSKLSLSGGGEKVYSLPAFDASESYSLAPSTVWKPASGKINLVWQTNFSHQITHDAINVIAPIWFSVDMRSGSIHISSSASKAAVDSYHTKGYQVWATIQSFTPGYTKLIVSNHAIGDQVIQSLTSAVNQCGIDGINFDFENMDPADKGLYTAFIARAANALHEIGAAVSVDVSNDASSEINWWTDGYSLSGLAQVSDYVCLMTYDQYFNCPGPSAASWWVENTVKSVLNKVPADKLIMGIPLYSYDWINGSTKKALTLGDFDKLKQNGQLKLMSGEVWTVSQWLTSPQFSSSTGTQYMKFKDTQGRTHEAWYEDAQSIDIKLEIITRYNLAGACSWRYGFSSDKTEIWDVYKNRLK